MKISILGGNAAGLSAAAKAKRILKTAEITVYEKTELISWGTCGLPYLIGSYFDNPGELMARSAEDFARSGIDIKTSHEALSVDVHAKSVTVKNLRTGEAAANSYDKLMVATGASPVMPSIKNISLENVYTIKELDSALNLKEKLLHPALENVCVIGAGFIGLEMAESLVKRGKNVTVLDIGESVLYPAFDKEIAALLEAHAKSHGIKIVLDEHVRELVGETAVQAVVTDKNSYPAELVIVSAGVVPNTAFLKDTGIAALPNGAILIDKTGRTNIENIFAAGDCASVYHSVTKSHMYIPLATTANKIGRIAGENLVGGNAVFMGTLGSACIKFMELEAGRTGLSEHDAKANGIACKSVFITDKNHPGYYPGQENLHIKLLYDPATNRILGGQTAGKNGAVLRADVIAAAIAGGLTVEELGFLDLCYAPPFARPWDALNIAGNAV